MVQEPTVGIASAAGKLTRSPLLQVLRGATRLSVSERARKRWWLGLYVRLRLSRGMRLGYLFFSGHGRPEDLLAVGSFDGGVVGRASDARQGVGLGLRTVVTVIPAR